MRTRGEMWQLPKRRCAGKAAGDVPTPGGDTPSGSSPARQLGAAAALVGGHLLPAWHLPRCPSSSPARLTLRSGARLMTGLIDLCRGSAPRREIDAGTRSRLCKKPFLPPAQPGSTAPRPRGSAHRSGQGSMGMEKRMEGRAATPPRGPWAGFARARSNPEAPRAKPTTVPGAGVTLQRRPREPAAHTRSNSRNRPSRSAPRFARFAHRGSIAPQKSLGQALCAAGAKRCSRHDPSGATAARPGTRRQPEGWESRARPGTALPTPAPSLAAARHLHPLPPPAPLRHSPALPASTAGCAGAERLPREQKRSVRGDRRHGRFYRRTGTVVPLPRSPGEGPPPGAPPLHPARRHPAGPGWGSRGSPSPHPRRRVTAGRRRQRGGLLPSTPPTTAGWRGGGTPAPPGQRRGRAPTVGGHGGLH